MSDFIWKQSKFREIPAFLSSNAEGFRESPEYQQLADYELEISGVVVSAFARYLCRLHEQEQAGDTNVDLAGAIASAHDAIEVLAASPESAVHDLLTDELYENLDCQGEVLERLRQQLRPAALAIYDSWHSKQDS